jgi:ATP-dependent DNA helicase RecQ
MGTVGVQPDLSETALTLLRTVLESPTASFRPDQWEAIEALLARERLLVVERTGWGKSMVYFLATRLLRQRGAGCTLLISPLLSLMRNQIEAARRIGVRAETINSANVDDWPPILAALRQNQVDLLLISPERLANDEFVTRCLLPISQQIGLLVVDEAHCISDWGHDFRPDYRRIVRILRALPANIPVLATTATANDRVVEDVEQQLGPNLRTIRGPLTRESLRLQNLVLTPQAARMAWIADQIPRMEGSGIIYTLTTRDADRLAAWLQSRGINALAYHSRMEDGREKLEDQLLRNEIKVLVATVALGMGFDKPDLSFVIHFQRPASVVHYYQQVGRAGRALENAHGILLGGAEDDNIADYFIHTAFPTEEEIHQVLVMLREARGPVTITAMQQHVNLTKGKLEKVLKFLHLESPTPIQRTEDGYVLNPVRWQMPSERILRITNLRQAEQDRMRAYMATNECLMQFLSRELSDDAAGPCGKCANCGLLGLATAIPQPLAEAATEFLNNLAFPIEPRKMWPGRMTFEGMHGRIPPELQNQPGRALCRWGDPGFGDLVREGKQQTGLFPGRLLEAAVRLIRQQWIPQPPPAWLTCVPSGRYPGLVSDFARRLADALGIPYVQCIQRLRQTEPQKTRQNTYQQVKNLERAFQIDHNLVRHGPVLLVDDMVDSRWTMTVLGTKLRQAGSGPVFPFALADSSQDGDE